jgi:hypothetical protein
MKKIKILLVNVIFIFLLLNIRFSNKKTQEETIKSNNIVGIINYSIWKNLSLFFDYKNDQYEFFDTEMKKYLRNSKYKRKLQIFLSKSIDRFE